MHPPAAAATILGIEALAAEARPEGVGVLRLREAEHLPPLVLMEDAVAALAQRQADAERMNRAAASRAGTASPTGIGGAK
jgi:hypothetical protein